MAIIPPEEMNSVSGTGYRAVNHQGLNLPSRRQIFPGIKDGVGGDERGRQCGFQARMKIKAFLVENIVLYVML
jgi:hypothetical protein